MSTENFGGVSKDTLRTLATRVYGDLPEKRKQELRVGQRTPLSEKAASAAYHVFADFVQEAFSKTHRQPTDLGMWVSVKLQHYGEPTHGLLRTLYSMHLESLAQQQDKPITSVIIDQQSAIRVREIEQRSSTHDPYIAYDESSDTISLGDCLATGGAVIHGKAPCAHINILELAMRGVDMQNFPNALRAVEAILPVEATN